VTTVTQQGVKRQFWSCMCNRSNWHTANPLPKRGNRDERHRVYEQLCAFLCKRGGNIPAAGATHSNLLVRFSGNDFPEFLLQSAFTKLSIILVRFANPILENLNFAVYVCERVCVLLIVHDTHPDSDSTLWCLCSNPTRANRSRFKRRFRHQLSSHRLGTATSPVRFQAASFFPNISASARSQSSRS